MCFAGHTLIEANSEGKGNKDEKVTFQTRLMVITEIMLIITSITIIISNIIIVILLLLK